MAKYSADYLKKLYDEAKNLRSPYENDWRMAAAYCLPQHYASWQTIGPTLNNTSNAATKRIAYDSTGLRSLPKYAAILERMATPQGQRWHGLTPSDDSLRKSLRVRSYFDQVTNLLFKRRYDPRARFRVTTSEMWQAMGVYGNGPIFTGIRRRSVMSPEAGFSYISCKMSDCFVLVDDDGNVTNFFRRIWLNVRQFKMKWPNAKIPDCMAKEAAKAEPSEAAYFEFAHIVFPRDSDEYDPKSLTSRRHPWCGVYIATDKPEFVEGEEDKGYQNMPYLMPRPMSVAGDAYGYSPAIQALPSLGGASSIKKTNLKMGNKAVDPALLAHDDGVLGGTIDQRPGRINYGLVNKEGKPLVAAMPSGNFQVGEVLLQDERHDVEDSFFVTLFQILQESPEMTATEVIERVAERASLLSPTMGRIQSEFLGPDIEREIGMLIELGEMPEMPPELVEARGQYEVQYTSPLAKGMYAEEVSGFMRIKEMATAEAQLTGDMSALDLFNNDVAYPEIADYLAVPARWMNDENTITAKRDARAQQQQQAEMMKNSAGMASAAKTVSEMAQ